MSIRQRFSAAMQAFGRPELSAQAVTNPPSGTASPEGWFLRALGGGRSVSGQVVTPDSALRVMAVYAATRILAESMASLPISVYQADGTKRRRVSQHPLSTLLHDSPNPNNTAFEFVEMGQAHLGLRGNCYSWIDWSGAGEVQGLYPMHPDKVVPRYDKTARKFTYDLDGINGVPAHHVLHIRGFSLDGLLGLSPIGLARETLGLAMAAEQVGNEAFSDGFVPPIVLEVSERADKDQRATYRREWVDLIRQRRNGPPVISGGMKLHALRLSMADLQFIESRRFSITEIARLFRIPLHMLGDLERATNNNIEQLSLEFVKYTLAPWIKRWEQRLNLTLLSRDERTRGLYMKFNVDALLRGDIKSRYEAYRIGLEGRILNANDVREMEDRDAYDGGDEFWAPLNMAPVSVPREKKDGQQ
ncbi:phage portal protein [Burkholderia vietnamiensis]|uniref:phage portal protein n=1 Tax=Burkholderia vietnamiensis TaxID=60552 RepID=UPI00264EF03F|nr:phage portal protein [Burkholderia vietnamiensis]MDN7924399.1 phage portal protein [Burkholderia vietnamiensis]